MAGDYRLLFGDIHNHNAMGYGVGSMARSIDVARTHLDFFAFTGHSSWHDMVPMEGGREGHWTRGFERLRDGWPEVQDLVAGANEDGAFAAFLGFEWHSSHFGDQCVVFPDDGRPLAYPDHIDGLRAFCLDNGALMVPHHLAYPAGNRGVNWDAFDEACTPVVEIFSEHGNSEDDRGPYPFFNHSMGGRQTSNTVQAALDRGLRFGFVASSDSHNAFPGAHGEGLLGVLAADLERASILEAIRARRTYALTGDRMEVDFAVDGAVMGRTIRAGAQVDVAFEVRGRDEMDMVEIVQDGRVVHRAFADVPPLAQGAISDPFQVRLEWGWGPWGDLALDRVCDWEFDISVSDGRLLRAFPCLQSGPFDEDRRHRFTRTGDNGLAVTSYTARRGGYRGLPTQSLILEVAGGPATAFELRLRRPADQTTTTTAAQLAAGSLNLATGPFPKETYQWHRLVPLAASRVAGACRLPVPEGPSHVYLRARQRNGQMAWASPVYLNYGEGEQT
ncbi:MAG: hypothetical protein H6907_11000 [Hyphomicrobiales bacterium]|nr:hypothetical protein [Hyphomicrobiales bacterium]